MGSDLFVAFPDGETLERSASAPYLGTVLSADGKPDLEVSHRVSEAWGTFRKLSPVWKAPVSNHKKVAVYRACVLSRLTCGLHVLELTSSRIN
eukprot:12314864-Alexandrium_andersonii.AAC.1